MSDKTVNMFEVVSGLPLDGARVHSVAAQFTYNQEYSADAVVLDIEWQPIDEEGENEGESRHQLYSVGKSWEPADGGESVMHTSGNLRNWNSGTNISKILVSLLEARGDGDPADGMRAFMDEGIYPHEAAFWLNMDVTLKSIEYETQSGKKSTTFGVGEWHGRVGEVAEKPKTGKATASKAALAPKAGAGKAKAAEPETSASGEDDWKEHLGQALFRKLKKVAEDAKDHDAFMDAAFGVDGAEEGDKAWKKITEGIIMDYSDTGLFATARA